MFLNSNNCLSNSKSAVAAPVHFMAAKQQVDAEYQAKKVK